MLKDRFCLLFSFTDSHGNKTQDAKSSPVNHFGIEVQMNSQLLPTLLAISEM